MEAEFCRVFAAQQIPVSYGPSNNTHLLHSTFAGTFESVFQKGGEQRALIEHAYWGVAKQVPMGCR